jgi:uncharacterized protein (UPF0335 family)
MKTVLSDPAPSLWDIIKILRKLLKTRKKNENKKNDR